MIMMCGPTWNSAPLPIACDLLGTHLPPYMYEIPTRLRDKIHRRAETRRSLTDPNVNPLLSRQKESLYEGIPSYLVISNCGTSEFATKGFYDSQTDGHGQR